MDVVSVEVLIAQANATRLLSPVIPMDVEIAQDQDHQVATRVALQLATTNRRIMSQSLIKTAKETSSHLQGIAINLCHVIDTVAPVHPQPNSITVATRATNTLTTIDMSPLLTKSILTESDTMVHSKKELMQETNKISLRLISQENKRNIITTKYIIDRRMGITMLLLKVLVVANLATIAVMVNKGVKKIKRHPLMTPKQQLLFSPHQTSLHPTITVTGLTMIKLGEANSVLKAVGKSQIRNTTRAVKITIILLSIILQLPMKQITAGLKQMEMTMSLKMITHRRPRWIKVWRLALLNAKRLLQIQIPLAVYHNPTMKNQRNRLFASCAAMKIAKQTTCSNNSSRALVKKRRMRML